MTEYKLNLAKSIRVVKLCWVAILLIAVLISVIKNIPDIIWFIWLMMGPSLTLIIRDSIKLGKVNPTPVNDECALVLNLVNLFLSITAFLRSLLYFFFEL